MAYQLIIGNRNYSPWSLAAWLFMRESGFELATERVPLQDGDWRSVVARFGPAGSLPVLVDDNLGTSVWGALPIIEHLRDRYRDRSLSWPTGPEARALGWSVCTEACTGFAALREQMPLNLRARCQLALTEPLASDVARMRELWRACRSAHGERGPWLFGRLSIPDVVLAPEVLRFVSYGVDAGDEARPYVDALLGLESLQEWVREAIAEPERWPAIDAVAERAPVAVAAPPGDGGAVSATPPAVIVEDRVDAVRPPVGSG